ncbi:hypothetical protein SAZ10_13195 [Mesorhizobium sp. BAC0120]|uniref:hypothetical protein n=1 Tax=Mesorhizobium sp. BAC0120 TaxID=3090670 RepID=UPI00298BD665|nr:hypothetical protein [Mesorhizobium sp. BAC0120]MDW6022712.1 hypothetical protein [Mesorhizobium sp. BAC0120]
MSEPDNEYLELPDDPEEAFAALHRKKFKALEASWENNNSGWYLERQYVDTLIAFDEVHALGILTEFRNPPLKDDAFSGFFEAFRRHAEITSQKILMEAARRQKTNIETVVVLDATARQTIHTLIGAIRERLYTMELPEDRRQSLFNKLNAFASEVDRNRTKTEAFFAFAVEAAKVARQVDDELKPLQQTIDRIFEWIEKAKKLRDALPPWSERKQIEAPKKALPNPDKRRSSGFSRSLDEDIPF